MEIHVYVCSYVHIYLVHVCTYVYIHSPNSESVTPTILHTLILFHLNKCRGHTNIHYFRTATFKIHAFWITYTCLMQNYICRCHRLPKYCLGITWREWRSSTTVFFFVLPLLNKLTINLVSWYGIHILCTIWYNIQVFQLSW